MASIKLKFRAHADNTKTGVLYFQVIHDRVVKQVKTDYRIYEYEWDKRRGDIVKEFPLSAARKEALRILRDKVLLEQRKLEQIVKSFENIGKPYTADDIILRYKESASDKTTVFEYMRRQSERMKKLGRVRTGETYRQTLRSFMRFRNGIDLYFDMLDADMVGQYESYMRANNLSRNTTSFYMRILRCIYNRAVEEGLAQQILPFRRVYTGVDKTAKRAITLKEVRRIKELDLTNKPDLDYARDMFLFSFYLRGHVIHRSGLSAQERPCERLHHLYPQKDRTAAYDSLGAVDAGDYRQIPRKSDTVSAANHYKAGRYGTQTIPQ